MQSKMKIRKFAPVDTQSDSTKEKNTWKDYINNLKSQWVGKKVIFDNHTYTVMNVDYNGFLLIDKKAQHTETTAVGTYSVILDEDGSIQELVDKAISGEIEMIDAEPTDTEGSVVDTVLMYNGKEYFATLYATSNRTYEMQIASAIKENGGK